MPWKDIEKQRAAIRRHYYANKQSYVDKAIKRKKEIRKWVNSVKESAACLDCKVNYPYYVMDFDHIGEKKAVINKLIDNCSIKGLKEEIAKCEVVCANCHRIRTHNRANQE
jgi:hypothetical protein